MSLATVKGDKPWVTEVHFVYDDDLNIYWRSFDTRRHSQEINANPHVAGNIVKQCVLGEPCPGAVYFEGTAEKVDDLALQQAILPKFVSRVGASDKAIEEAAAPEGNKFYKISVSNWAVFGNVDGSGFNKYEIAWQAGKNNES